MTANNKSNNTVNRSRDKLLKVYVNEEEKNIIAVSYTHLDVYKRQILYSIKRYRE